MSLLSLYLVHYVNLMVGGRMKSRERAKTGPQLKKALNIVGILGLADSLTHRVTPEFLGSKH